MGKGGRLRGLRNLILICRRSSMKYAVLMSTEGRYLRLESFNYWIGFQAEPVDVPTHFQRVAVTVEILHELPVQL